MNPPPLNLIRLGNEWLVTNGVLAGDGSVQFPEADPSEEVFACDGMVPINTLPAKPTSPSSEYEA
jgi:hypothetical protein